MMNSQQSTTDLAESFYVHREETCFEWIYSRIYYYCCCGYMYPD